MIDLYNLTFDELRAIILDANNPLELRKEALSILEQDMYMKGRLNSSS